MNKELQSRIERLYNQIDDLRYRYHVLNDPGVTDAMYDGLMDELRKIEEKNPELITPESPTQRVAGIPLDRFEKVQHLGFSYFEVMPFILLAKITKCVPIFVKALMT